MNILGDRSLDSISDQSRSLCSTLSKFKDYPPKEYEELIQKLEGDIRMHIRVEQQMRLHIENLQQKIEDIERESSHGVKKVRAEVLDLKEENRRLRDREEQVKRKESESKRKYYEKMKAMEDHYEQVIKKLVSEMEGKRSGKNYSKCESIKSTSVKMD